MHSHAVDCFVDSNFEQRIGNLGADDLSDRGRHQKAGQRSRPVPAGKPVRQIHNDSRKKSGFRQAEQKANEVELGRRLHERGQRGHDAPGNHDPADPFAGAPLLHEKGPWDFQQEVTNEEQARAKANYGIVEAGQIAGHGQLGDGDVRAVHIGDDVADKE